MSIAVLITARLKSTRLRQKVLKPIMGRPMLYHLVERLRLAAKPKKIIVCTSTVAQDDALQEFAEQVGVECYRGDPDDVLLRMLEAAEFFGVETIVSCTADNPFVDPIYIDRLVEYHLKEDNDFSRSEGLPFGTFAYVLKREAVKKAVEIKANKDTEVWGGYFTETGIFRWSTMAVNDRCVNWSELRLTVDEIDDFDMVTEIFNQLYQENKVFPLEDIVSLCRNRPNLVSMNASVKQKDGAEIKLKEDGLLK